MLQLILNIFTIPVAFAQQTSDKAAGVATQTGGQIQGLAATIVSSLPLWITGLIVIMASFAFAKIVKSSVENKMSEEGFEEEHREIQIVTGRAAAAGVLILGITIGLKIAGIDLTSIIAAGAFGIGFAMKDFIMNFFAGIIILLQKQFTIGDWIKIGGTVGVIEAIQSRYTVIRNFDGTKVIIPNSDLFKKQVTNLTSNPYRRFQLELGVDLYLSLKEVSDVILKTAAKIKSISMIPKKPSIHVLKPGSYYNNLQIRCWVISKKGIAKPQSDLIKAIHKEFYLRGWSFPYPMETIMFDKDIQPDVSRRAEDYIKNHKKQLHHRKPLPDASALAQEAGLMKQQQLILAQNTPVENFPSQLQSDFSPLLQASPSPQVQPVQNYQVPTVENPAQNDSPQIFLTQPPLVAEHPLTLPSDLKLEIAQPVLTDIPIIPESNPPVSIQSNDQVPQWLENQAQQIQPPMVQDSTIPVQTNTSIYQQQ